MRNEVARVLCYGCPKEDIKVKSYGEKFGVNYVVTDSDHKYIIRDNNDISWDDIMKKMEGFQDRYVPKFGKYEIEKFVCFYLKEALLITKDMTELFNMEVIHYDYWLPNVTRFSADVIKERLLKLFDVVEETQYITYLKFKW